MASTRSCGCTTDTSAHPVAASSGACTLGMGEMATRLDKWRALLDHDPNALQGVVARRALDDGRLCLELAPNSDVTEIARSTAAEHGCCPFFGFTVTIDGRGLAREVHAPTDGQPVLADLFGTAG